MNAGNEGRTTSASVEFVVNEQPRSFGEYLPKWISRQFLLCLVLHFHRNVLEALKIQSRDDFIQSPISTTVGCSPYMYHIYPIYKWTFPSIAFIPGILFGSKPTWLNSPGKSVGSLLHV
jgi:hypothetical protein